VALRYSCTYGPRQSSSSPGVIAISARLLNNLPPILDGNQTRDMSFVEGIARQPARSQKPRKLDGLPVNGGNHGVAIREYRDNLAALRSTSHRK
jgi:dTDP-L-rhamnose 4-epimerase